MSTSSSDTIGFGRVGYYQSRYRRTKFLYGKYMVACATPPAVPQAWYSARVASFAGGAQDLIPTQTPAADRCVPYQRGATHIKNTSKAVTWTGGVESAGTLGVNLNIRTGYSNAAKTVFTFYGRRHLCGTGDFPGGTPYQLVAKY
jgi:hypothetical protein